MPSGKADIVPGYDFLVNSVWPEIIRGVEERVSSLFNPGNPDVFYEVSKVKTCSSIFIYFLLYSLNDIIFYNGNVHFIKWFSLFLCSVMQRYTVSMDFVRKFERQCGSQASVKRLRAHPCYQSFHNKWNLPVYFQLRWVWGLEIQSQLYHSSALSVNVQFFRSIQPGTSVWPICHLHCDIVYIEIKQSIPHQKVQRKRFL